MNPTGSSEHKEDGGMETAIVVVNGVDGLTPDMLRRRPDKFRGRAKLTADQVREIRTSSESSRAAGKRYGVDKAVIQRVRNGKSYAHVQ